MSDKRRVTKIADGVSLLKGIDFECCIWLIEGEDRALLVDTGVGNGDLRSEVEALIDVPYEVVNTHGHGDHSGGNYLFDKVYMHSKAFPDAQGTFELTKMFVSADEASRIEEFMSQHSPEVEFISEGYTFDLGGRKLEVIEVPGHTAGDIALYDRENGLLFSGDSMVQAMDVLLVVPSTVSVECYAASMHRLEGLEGLKGFCSGHDQKIMPVSFLHDAVCCADEILDGTADAIVADTSDLPDVGETCMRAVHGDCAILYRPSRIR